MKRWLWILAGLLTLIPLSVDDIWSISVSQFRLRINYFGALLAFGLIAREIATKSALCEKLLGAAKRYAREPFVWSFLAMSLVGLLGVAQSSAHFRSACFLVWSAGTILLVPFLIEGFTLQFGKWVPRAFIGYLGLQSLIILLDAGICMPTGGAYSIGRILVYHSDQGNLCRPHAWYHEPGFYSAFALLGLVVTLLWLKRESSPLFRKLTAGALVTILLSIIASTSRMGWVGVGGFLVFELFQISRHPISTEKKRKLLLAGSMPIALLAVLAGWNWHPIYQNVGQGVVHPTQDSSFKYRYARLHAGYEVFRHNPWVGAGPGTANVYFATYLHDGLLMEEIGADLPRLTRDPLSQNLYTELLSEWGVLGTILFFLGLFYFTRELPFWTRIEALAILLVVYSSSQTLPRFDLWAALGLIRVLSLHFSENHEQVIVSPRAVRLSSG